MTFNSRLGKICICGHFSTCTCSVHKNRMTMLEILVPRLFTTPSFKVNVQFLFAVHGRCKHAYSYFLQSNSHVYLQSMQMRQTGNPANVNSQQCGKHFSRSRSTALLGSAESHTVVLPASIYCSWTEPSPWVSC